METKTTRKRHKWNSDIPIKTFPHEVYKVSQCTKCSLVRLHERIGSVYSKSYLIGGKRYDELPECKE